MKYDAPFGIAPIGLQGLMWPKACELLAAAAHEQNIPFCLSTVSTSSIENVANITDGRAWFQLYHPAEEDLRDKLVARAADDAVALGEEVFEERSALRVGDDVRAVGHGVREDVEDRVVPARDGVRERRDRARAQECPKARNTDGR